LQTQRPAYKTANTERSQPCCSSTQQVARDLAYTSRPATAARTLRERLVAATILTAAAPATQEHRFQIADSLTACHGPTDPQARDLDHGQALSILLLTYRLRQTLREWRASDPYTTPSRTATIQSPCSRIPLAEDNLAPGRRVIGSSNTTTVSSYRTNQPFTGRARVPTASENIRNST